MTRRPCSALAVLLATALVLGPLAVPARAAAVASPFPAWVTPGFLGQIWSFLEGLRGGRGLDLRASGAIMDPNGIAWRHPAQAASGFMIDPDG